MALRAKTDYSERGHPFQCKNSSAGTHRVHAFVFTQSSGTALEISHAKRQVAGSIGFNPVRKVMRRCLQLSPHRRITRAFDQHPVKLTWIRLFHLKRQTAQVGRGHISASCPE